MQKKQELNIDEITALRRKKLIEGRRPNIYISKSIAETTGQKAEYIKQKGFNKTYYKDMIIKYLNEFGKATRKDFENMLFDKLPEIMDEKQKRYKVRNLLTELKNTDNKIEHLRKANTHYWVLKKN